jgi:hypothetical protein
MRNRRGDDSIPITILTIGVVAVCMIAYMNFLSLEKNVRNSFVGLGIVEELNSQIEGNYFYGREIGMLSPSANIFTAINYAKEERLVNRGCECGDNCEEYARAIEKSSLENGIPNSLLLLSLMMQESDCISSAFSGSSTGLMQINLIHCGNYGLPLDKIECKKQLIENTELNIEVGAKILKEYYNTYGEGKLFNGCSNLGITYTGWDAALRGYNGWGCGKDSNGNPYVAQDKYVDEVNERYEILGKQGDYLEKEKIAGVYLEKEKTTGILWWKKTTLLFSAEYKGKP